MSTQHTPGPWASSDQFRDEGAPLFVATMARTGNERRIVCRISNKVSGRPLEDEDYANARLIAAAPDLLEAAQKVLSNKRGEDDWLILAVHCQELAAAIAKATGEKND